MNMIFIKNHLIPGIMYPGVYLGLCVDLIQQTAEVGHFLLQVFSLDLQLVAQGLGFLVWVQ